MKKKNNTTLSEQFKIRTEKANKEAKLIPLTHIYTNIHTLTFIH